MKTCYWIGHDEHDMEGPFLLYANAVYYAKLEKLMVFVQEGDAPSGKPEDAKVVLRKEAKP